MTVLLTGFGPFPGMPLNPTPPLVNRLARLKRPSFADIRRVAYVFDTSYAAVDQELPALIARHRPDALLMFGVAGRTRKLRVETLARNRTTVLRPDVARAGAISGVIAASAPARLTMHTPAARLLAAARSCRVPAARSSDAGHYLCNYLCWRATEFTSKERGPRVAAFIHVPNIPRAKRRTDRAIRRRLTLDDLVRGAEAMLVAVVTAARAR